MWCLHLHYCLNWLSQQVKVTSLVEKECRYHTLEVFYSTRMWCYIFQTRKYFYVSFGIAYKYTAVAQNLDTNVSRFLILKWAGMVINARFIPQQNFGFRLERYSVPLYFNFYSAFLKNVCKICVLSCLQLAVLPTSWDYSVDVLLLKSLV